MRIDIFLNTLEILSFIDIFNLSSRRKPTRVNSGKNKNASLILTNHLIKKTSTINNNKKKNQNEQRNINGLVYNILLLQFKTSSATILPITI